MASPDSTDFPPLAFTDLTERPTALILALPLGVRVRLTYRGQDIGTVIRPYPAPGSFPDLPQVRVVDLTVGSYDRAEALRAGGGFVLTRHDRRVAVIEGVKA